MVATPRLVALKIDHVSAPPPRFLLETVGSIGFFGDTCLAASRGML
jgi:hypothetical protein